MNRIWPYFLILCFTLIALNLTLAVPFYYSWDMDLTTVLDLLLMQSNQIPAHMNHPGMGMYWVLYWFQWLAQHSGLITSVSMSNIGDSLEPFLLLAEQMQFIRIINTLICILLAVTLWRGLRSYLKTSGWSDASLLLIFLTVPGVWRYDLLLVRTETFSLLFWCMSLLYTLRAAEQEEKKDKIFAGLFAALSFFTKIQSFFLVILLVLIYALLKKAKEEKPIDLKKVKMVVYLVGFAAVALGAKLITKPVYVADFADFYKLNKFFFCFYALLVVLFVLSFQWKRWQPFSDIQNFIFYFVCGAAIVMLIPLLSPLNLATSLRYSLLSFKMVFIRETKFAALDQLALISNLKQLIKDNWYYMIVLAASALTVFMKKGSRKIILVFLVGLTTVQIILGVRSSIQDGLWIEIPLIVLSLILVGQIKSKWAQVSYLAIVVLNIYQITGFKSFKVMQGIAYFDSHSYFDEVYGFNMYKPIMDERYKTTDERNAALAVASRLSEIRSILANNFSDSGAGLRDVTVIDGKLWISLKSVSASEFKLLYRPDLTQSVYVPADQKNNLHVEVCDQFKTETLMYKNVKYEGVRLKAVGGKGIYPANCTIQSEYLKNGFVLVENKAMATFKNSEL